MRTQPVRDVSLHPSGLRARSATWTRAPAGRPVTVARRALPSTVTVRPRTERRYADTGRPRGSEARQVTTTEPGPAVATGRPPDRRRGRTSIAYVCLVVALAISTPVGLVLAWVRHG